MKIEFELQALQKKLRAQDCHAVEAARVALDQAAGSYREQLTDDTRDVNEAALREYNATVTRSGQYTQDTAFKFKAAYAEKSTKHFF